MTASLRKTDFASMIRRTADHRIVAAYNDAGSNYLSYADGGTGDLFAFTGQYAYGDRQIWMEIDWKLRALLKNGMRHLRVLDLGCGPGTWLCRVVSRARAFGFESITARGIDIADGQIELAQSAARKLSGNTGLRVNFEVGDILDPLPERENEVDLCLCLNGVLNHLTPSDVGRVLAAVARVTRNYFIATVRAIGSIPTIYVEGMEAARAFHQDNRLDKLDVELANGRHMSFNSHLFSAAEFAGFIAGSMQVEDVRGLDLFHGRFAGEPRWNPPNATPTQVLTQELDRLEQTYCRAAEFIDHATHLLLVAKKLEAA